MDMRTKILTEATRRMAARGYEGTSLQAVADAVGVKKPSLLYHFRSKQDLHQAVLDGVLSRWSEVLPRLLMASTKTGLAKFDAVVEELVRFFADEPDRARLLVRELLDRPDQMQDVLREQVQPWFEVVASYIEKGQQTGQIRPEVDAHVFVVHVVSMALFGLATARGAGPLLRGNDEAAVDRTVRELIRMARTSLFTEGYLEHQSNKRARAQGAD